MCLLLFRLAILGRSRPSSACAKMAAHLIARLLPVVLMERPGAFKARMKFFRLAFLPSRPDALNRLSLAMSVARWAKALAASVGGRLLGVTARTPCAKAGPSIFRPARSATSQRKL